MDLLEYLYQAWVRAFPDKVQEPVAFINFAKVFLRSNAPVQIDNSMYNNSGFGFILQDGSRVTVGDLDSYVGATTDDTCVPTIGDPKVDPRSWSKVHTIDKNLLPTPGTKADVSQTITVPVLGDK